MTIKKFLLPAILVIAAILRVVALLKYGDFWDDEIFNVIYSQKPWPAGLKYWLWETNPPLHLFVLKIWLFIFPATEFLVRLPSMIAGVVAVYATYQLGKEIFNRQVGLLGAFYLAIHPYHIFWSATGRVYSLLMLLTVWSASLFYKIYFSEHHTRRTKIIFAVTNFFLIFSHLSSVFFIAGQFIILLIARGKKQLIDWIRVNLLPFAIGGTWITFSILIKHGNNFGQAWFLNIVNSGLNFLEQLFYLTVGNLGLKTGIVIIAILLALSGITLYRDVINKKTPTLCLFALIFLPMLLAMAFNVWQIKFFIGVLPLASVFVAYAAISTFKKIPVAILLIATICTVGLYYIYGALPLSQWTKISEYAEAHSAGRTALVYNNFILKHQIDHYLPKAPASPLPLDLYPDLNWDDKIVKKNYIFKLISEQEKDDWYAQNNISEYDTVILLQGEYAYMNKLNSLLERHGWRLKESPVRASICGRYYLSVYEKNIRN